MKNQSENKIKKLISRGLICYNPDSVEIGNDVDIERISCDGVVIYSGCKIFGSSTLILKNTRLGYEAPVTVENCQIGSGVELKGGFFSKSVFLDHVSIGSGAHVREGTILEEKTRIAHTVGLKQTILFPYVTLGSLINFCDCLMSGGTSSKNHSEVGSSYIHFNYTPSQDKATPSLLGDVPNGVMLNQKPIFLGGQGGLVGPCRLAFGTVIGAGSICRKDELRPGRLIIENAGKSGNVPFSALRYQNKQRIITNNLIYIGNLYALKAWYTHVRSMFISDNFPEPLLEGLTDKICLGIEERIKRFKELYLKIFHMAQKNDWPNLENILIEHQNDQGDTYLKDLFLEKIRLAIEKNDNDYISVIKGLKPEDAAMGTRWLSSIVETLCENTGEKKPFGKV
jgi:UDP-N-acetylglucosamine/UDP-N-acetylgalactosamine diphosphorylase